MSQKFIKSKNNNPVILTKNGSFRTVPSFLFLAVFQQEEG